MPTFQEIYNKHNDAIAQGLISQDEPLSTFAQRGFQVTGDPSYKNVADSGWFSNALRSRSADLSNLIESGPVDEFTSAAVGRIGDLFGITPETSRAVGKKLPRMAVDFLPMAAAAVAAPFTGGGSLVPLAGLAGTSALSAASAFEETGRPLDAIIGGVAPYVGGKLSDIGSRAALNFAARSPVMQRLGFTGGTKVTSLPGALTAQELGQVGTLAPATLAQTTATRTMLDRPLDKLLGYVGGEAAANVGFTGLDILQQGKDAVLNRDYLFSNLVSNIPFAAIDMAQSAQTRQLGRSEFNIPEAAPVYLTPGEQRSARAAAMFEGMEDPAQIEALKRRYGLDIANIELNAEKLRAAQINRRESQQSATDNFVARWNNYLDSDPLFNQATNGEFRITQGGAFGRDLVGLGKVLDAENLPERAKEIVDEFKDQRVSARKKYDNVVRSMVQPVSMEESLKRSVEELGLDEFLATPIEERDYNKALSKTVLSPEGIELVRDIQRAEAGLKPLNQTLWKEFEDFYLGKRTDLDFDKRVDMAVAVSLARGNRAKLQEARAKAKEATQEGQKDPVVVEEFVKTLEEDAKTFVQNDPKIQADAKAEEIARVEQEVLSQEQNVEAAKNEVRRLDITPEQLAAAQVNLDNQLRSFVAKAEEAKRLRTEVAQAAEIPAVPPVVVSPGMRMLEERMTKMSAAGKAKWTPEVMKAAEEFFLTGDTKLVDGLPEQSVRTALRSIFMDVTPGGEKQLAKGDKVLEESVKLAKANAARLKAAKLEKKEVDPELAKLLKEYELASSDKDMVYLIPVPEGDFETVRPFAEKLMAKLVPAGEVKERSAELVELAKFFNNPEVVYARLKGVVEGQGDAQFATDKTIGVKALQGLTELLPSQLDRAQVERAKVKYKADGKFEPVVFTYDPKSGLGLMTDGNHKLQAAIELGVERIPVELRRAYAKFSGVNYIEGFAKPIAQPGQEIKNLSEVLEKDINLAQTAGKIFGAASYSQKKIFINSEAFNGLNAAEKLGFIFAHEHAHISFAKALDGSYGPEARALAETAQRWVMTADPQAKQVVRDVLMDLHLPKELRDADGIREVLNNDDPNEWLANAMALYTGGAIKASKPKMAFAMLPKPVRNFFEWAVQGMQNLFKGAQTWFKLGGDKDKLAQISTVKNMMDTIRRSYRQAEWDAAQAEAFLRIQPEDMVQKAVDLQFAKAKPSARTGDPVFKEEPKEWLWNQFNRTVAPLHNIARLNKVFREPVLAILGSEARIKNDVMDVEKLVWGEMSSGNKIKVNAKDLERIESSPPLRNLFRDLMLHATEFNRRVVKEGLTPGTLEMDLNAITPALRGRLAQFNPEAQQALVRHLSKMEMANRLTQTKIAAPEKEGYAYRLATLLANKNSFNKAQDFEKAPDIAMGVIDDLMANRPDQATAKLSMLDEVDRVKTLETAQILTKQFMDLQNYYNEHPMFMSLRRFKQLKQRIEKPGQPDDVVDADTPGELEMLVKEYEARGWKRKKGVIREKDKKSKDQYQMNDDLLDLIRTHDNEMRAHLETLGLTDDVKSSILSQLDTVDMVAREINGKELYRPKGARKFVGDKERFDPMEQFMRYTPAAISAANKRSLGAKMNFLMQNPKMDNLQTQKDQLMEHYKQSSTVDPNWAMKLNKANAAWHIAWNIPGHIAETFQPMLSHLHGLVAEGDGIVQAVGRLAKAEAQMTKVQIERLKSLKDNQEFKFKHGNVVYEGLPAFWLKANGTDKDNLDIADMLRQKAHRVQRAPMSEVRKWVGEDHQRLEALANGEKTKSLPEMIATPLHMYVDAGLGFYSQFPMHNGVVALVSGYRQARAKGQSHADAVNTAELFDLAANNSGGRLERPAIFDKLGGAGHIVYSLSSYVRGRFVDLATFYRHGYNSKDYPELTPAQAANNRKAFKTMILAQLGAAGLMGLPFVGSGIALMEELLGEDIKGRMYEALDEVTNDPTLTRALTHGFMSSFAESLGIPADMHSRFALNSFLGTNAYDGVSAKSFLGPNVAMLESLWKLGGSMAQGKSVEEALTAAGPGAVKRLAEALSDDFQQENPDASLAWSALGFRSGKMTKLKELKRIADRRETESRRDLELAATRISEQLADPATARKALFDEAIKMVPTDVNPALQQQQLRQNIKDLSAKVAAMEANKVAPEDMRTQIAGRVAPQVANIGRAMGAQMNDPMELARSIAAQRTRSTLGQPLSQRPMRNAMMKDLQWQSNPWEF